MSAMTPAEVSAMLGISSSTLRKYCLLLEEQGVKFRRNANNSRKFTDMDVVTLQKMITLMNSEGVSVEDAVFTASAWVNGNPFVADESAATDNAIERHNDDITAALISEVRSLKDQIQEQQEVIDSFRLAQEQRDSYFVEILETLQGKLDELNEQKQLPEPDQDPNPQLLEEIEGLRKEVHQLNENTVSKDKAEKKRGFFSRWFK